MPISDPAPYEPGHFRRVYEHIIKPACIKAGFQPVRADEVERTNHIVLDVLRRILKADAVLCDLSAKSANVMYELGIRQAFNKPVVLIKDTQTERVFDIQGLRDIEYDAALRVDRIAPAINSIASSLVNTTDGASDEINSLVQLLGVQAATLPQRTEVSGETGLILNYLNEITQRLTALESATAPKTQPVKEVSAPRYSVGERVHHDRFGDGLVVDPRNKTGHVTVTFADGKKRLIAESDPEMDTDLPF
jgi:hypothetical protein